MKNGVLNEAIPYGNCCDVVWKNKMPKLLKQIIIIILIGITFSFATLPFVLRQPFAHPTRMIFFRLVGLVINVVILKGFLSRAQWSWHLARIFAFWGIIALFLSTVLSASYIIKERAIFHFLSNIIPLSLETFIFFALGNKEIRTYFEINTKTTQQTNWTCWKNRCFFKHSFTTLAS